MINKIEEWNAFQANNDAKIYFDELINYSNENSNVCVIEGQLKQKRKEQGKVANKDLQQVGNSFSFINNDMFSKIDIIKNSYKKMKIIK